MIRKIIFHETEFLLVSTLNEKEGAIATEEAFENFGLSFAHLGIDGFRRRCRGRRVTVCTIVTLTTVSAATRQKNLPTARATGGENIH